MTQLDSMSGRPQLTKFLRTENNFFIRRLVNTGMEKGNKTENKIIIVVMNFSETYFIFSNGIYSHILIFQWQNHIILITTVTKVLKKLIASKKIM